MYNEELKKRFIIEFSDSVSRRTSAKTLFKAIEPYENKYGEDFYTMNKDEVESIINEIVGARITSQNTRISILKEYIRWCKSNGLRGVSNAIFSINRLNIGIDKLKHQMVANPKHLQMYLNSTFDPESEETVDCIYRCFYWIAYSGMINPEDATNLNKSDVKLMDMLIVYNDEEYELYRESLLSFKNCINLTRFKVLNQHYYTDLYLDRAPSDKLLSGIKGPRKLTDLRSDISRKSKNRDKTNLDENLDLNLSYYRVWLSGIFYRCSEVERAGMPVDFSPIVEDFMEYNKDKYSNSNVPVKTNITRLINNYNKDYERWKEAYSI